MKRIILILFFIASSINHFMLSAVETLSANTSVEDIKGVKEALYTMSIAEIMRDTLVFIDDTQLELIEKEEIEKTTKTKIHALIAVNKLSSDTVKAMALWDMMPIYERQNLYSEFIELLDAYSETHSCSPLLKSTVLFIKARQLWRLGNYFEGERIAEEAKELYVNKNCSYEPLYIKGLNVLATIKYDIPKLEECINLCDTVIKVCEEKNLNSADLGKTYEQLAAIYCDLNQPDELFYYAQKSLDIFESLRDWGEMGIVSNTIAIYYFNTENDSLANVYFKLSLDYQIQNGDTTSSSYVMARSNYAMYYLDKDPKYAIELYEGIKQDAYRFMGEMHPWYGIVLHNLGSAYRNNKQYDQAEKVYNEVREIRSQTLSELHPHNLLLNETMLGLFYESEQWRKLLTIFDTDYSRRERYIRENFMVLSEKQRSDLWSAHQSVYQVSYPNYLLLLPDSLSHEATKRLYNLNLLTKGFLLGNSMQTKYAIANSGDSALQGQWQDYVSLKENITDLEQNTKQNQQLANIDSLRTLAQTYEKIFYKQTKSAQSAAQYWAINVDSVRHYLSDDAIAVEFFYAPIVDENFEATDTLKYYALLLNKDDFYPTLIYLGKEGEILSEAKTYKHGIEAPQKSLIWNGILSALKGRNVKTIYFSAAGALHNISMESIPIENNEPIQNHYNVIRLSSTRQIALKHSSEIERAVVYGGINYDADMTEYEEEPYQISCFDSVMVTRSAIIDSTYRAGVRYLKGAEQEAKIINSILQQENLKSVLFTNTEASEYSFKLLSGQKSNIIHVATHGFYSPKVSDNEEDEPLLRCGLLFAGANTALSGHSSDLPEGVQDGILTAKEISLLDLRDADLVVLSACETGKGEITGEGVFGLQRAFKQAGAQTIIMSLWPVNDAATQLLMTEFYRNWITEHQSKREAFRNAQNTVRSRYEEPVYWAGFIMLD